MQKLKTVLSYLIIIPSLAVGGLWFMKTGLPWYQTYSAERLKQKCEQLIAELRQQGPTAGDEFSNVGEELQTRIGECSFHSVRGSWTMTVFGAVYGCPGGTQAWLWSQDKGTWVETCFSH